MRSEAQRSGPLLPYWVVILKYTNTSYTLSQGTNWVHAMIQYLVNPPLEAITWNYYFLYDFISIAHCYGGILAHSSLHCCFISISFAGISLCTGLLRSWQSISIRPRSLLLLDCCKTLIFFFSFLLAAFPRKPHVFSLVLFWTLTLNMLTEDCRVGDGFSAIFCALHSLALR